MDIKSNNVYYGPGYWAVMHIESYNARTYEEKIVASNTISRIISTFPCKVCREHGIEYASQHPFINACNNYDVLSLFRWVWSFHNHVNRRIKKPHMSFEAAVQYWGDSSICKHSYCNE